MKMSQKIAGILEKPTRMRIWVVIIVLITIFFSYMDRVNVGVLLADDTFTTFMGIKADPIRKGTIMSAFLIVYGFSNALLGSLVDRLGGRKAMALALAIMSISMAVGGLATGFAMILISRAILGIGEGMQNPCSYLYYKQWFPPSERGRATSAGLVGMSLAPAIATPFFAYLIATGGWRFSFFAVAVLGLIPIALVWYFAADRPRDSKYTNAGERDYVEAGLAEEAARMQLKEIDAGETFWARIKPIMSNGVFWLAFSYLFVVNFINWAIITWLPSYLKVARGFSWAEMGWLSSLPFIMAVVAKGLSGILVDRFKRSGIICTIGMVITAGCLLSGILISNNWISAILIAIGVGTMMLGTPAVLTLAPSVVPTKSVGSAMGLGTAAIAGISACSPMIMGFAIQTTGNYNGGMYCLVGAAVIGIVISITLYLKKL